MTWKEIEAHPEANRFVSEWESCVERPHPSYNLQDEKLGLPSGSLDLLAVFHGKKACTTLDDTFDFHFFQPEILEEVKASAAAKGLEFIPFKKDGNCLAIGKSENAKKVEELVTSPYWKRDFFDFHQDFGEALGYDAKAIDYWHQITIQRLERKYGEATTYIQDYEKFKKTKQQLVQPNLTLQPDQVSKVSSSPPNLHHSAQASQRSCVNLSKVNLSKFQAAAPANQLYL